MAKSITNMQIKMVRRPYSLEKTVPLMVNDNHIRAEPDTGAVANVMDEYQYRALQHRSEYDMELRNSQTKLRTLQNELPIKGGFDAVLRNQTCGKRTKFLVIKGRISSPPLICKNTLIELGMLRLRKTDPLLPRMIYVFQTGYRTYMQWRNHVSRIKQLRQL